MAHEALKEAVWKANVDIVDAGLVVLTWGNASGIDREAGVMAIKPSGVPYEELRAEDIVIVSLETGRPVDSAGSSDHRPPVDTQRLPSTDRSTIKKPSSDTPTHLELYRRFDAIGGIVHTHSTHAVSWAQAEHEIPCFGTTHADHFNGPIPVTRRLREDEIRDDYEHHTGALIVECFRERDPQEIPGVLVAGHGPFVWGSTPATAVENAIALEEIARMALHTRLLDGEARAIHQVLREKHFSRKHGPDAYYGQPPDSA